MLRMEIQRAVTLLSISFMCLVSAQSSQADQADDQGIKTIFVLISPGITTPSLSRYYSPEHLKQSWFQRSGFGVLSDTGKRQMYSLGSIIQEEYPQIFKNWLKPNQIEAVSTGFSSSISSAISFLSALTRSGSDLKVEKNNPVLFPFRNIDDPSVQKMVQETDFKEALPFKTESSIVLNSQPSDDRTFFPMSEQLCPKINKIFNREMQVKSLLKFYETIPKYIQRVTDMALRLGFPIENLEPIDLFTLGPTMSQWIASKIYNNPKENSDPEFSDDPEIKFFLGLSDKAKFSMLGSQSTTVLKFLSSPVLAEIVGHLDEYEKQVNEKRAEKHSRRLLRLFSGDQLNMWAMLHALKVLDLTCFEVDGDCGNMPGPSSNVIFELIEKEGSAMFIKTRVDGKYLDLCPSDQSTPQNQPSCPYRDWRAFIEKNIHLNWFAECGENSQKDYTDFVNIFILSLSAGSFLLLILLIYTLTVFFKDSKAQQESAQNGTDSTGFLRFTGLKGCKEDYSLDKEGIETSRVKRM